MGERPVVIAATRSGGPILPIQYLRGIAALMVVWHHSLIQVPGITSFIRLPEFGPSGVDIFFVISGFIMVVTTSDRPITAARFFSLRLVRVVPLYWLATLLMIGCAIADPGAFRSLRFTLSAVTKSLFFVPYQSLSSPGNILPVLVPGWTLNFEMFFYGLFALSLGIAHRIKTLFTLLVALVVVGWIHGRFTSAPFTVYTSPMLLEFAAGLLIARSWMKGELRLSFALSACAILIGFYVLGTVNPRLTMAVGAGLLVLGCLNERICAFKSSTLLELGNASYSIYLTHLFALGALRVLWVRTVPTATLESSIAFMALAVVGSSIAGWICYRFIEKPMTDFLQGWMKRRAMEKEPLATLAN
jgi:exopolysaccharide production protein ExoZ